LLRTNASPVVIKNREDVIYQRLNLLDNLIYPMGL